MENLEYNGDREDTEYWYLDEDTQSLPDQEEGRRGPAEVNIEDIMSTIWNLETLVASLQIQETRQTQEGYSISPRQVKK